MKFALWLGIGIAMGLALLWMAGGNLLAEVALRPDRRLPSPYTPPMPTVEVQARDGARLKAWFISPPAATGACVIVLHGIADSRESSLGFARLFTEHGYSVLLPDSRGHGESEGKVVTYGILEADDVHRWVNLLFASQGCTKVFGLGESLGAGILLESLPVEPRFRAVVAESPFASLDRIARDRVAALLPLPSPIALPISRSLVESAILYSRHKYGIDPDAASPEDAVLRTQTPILLIHGLEDRKTPPEHSKILASRNPKIELWLVPGAGHTAAWAAAPDEFPRRVLAWFASHS